MPPVAEGIAKGDRSGLVALLRDAALRLKAQGIPRFGIIAPPATLFLRPLDPDAVGLDISARRPTVVLANRSGKALRGVEMGPEALADQTAKATGQIGEQIKAIQEATRSSALSIQGITETIGRVEDTAASISAAVEQQDAATREIARSVSQAAEATQEVTNTIASVSVAAGATGQAATRVLAASGEVSGNGSMLERELEAFLREVRAA